MSRKKLSRHIEKRHKAYRDKEKWPCSRCDRSINGGYRRLTDHFRCWHRLGHFGCAKCDFEANSLKTMQEHFYKIHKKKASCAKSKPQTLLPKKPIPRLRIRPLNSLELPQKQLQEVSKRCPSVSKGDSSSPRSATVRQVGFKCSVSNCNEICPNSDELTKHLAEQHFMGMYPCLLPNCGHSFNST